MAHLSKERTVRIATELLKDKKNIFMIHEEIENLLKLGYSKKDIKQMLSK